MAGSIYVPLTTPAKEALYELAEREDRDPPIQAARFIREGLERAGALTDPAEHLVAGSRAAAAGV